MTSACMGRGQGLDEEQLSRCFPKKLTLQRLPQRKIWSSLQEQFGQLAKEQVLQRAERRKGERTLS